MSTSRGSHSQDHSRKQTDDEEWEEYRNPAATRDRHLTSLRSALKREASRERSSGRIQCERRTRDNSRSRQRSRRRDHRDDRRDDSRSRCRSEAQRGHHSAGHDSPDRRRHAGKTKTRAAISDRTNPGEAKDREGSREKASHEEVVTTEINSNRSSSATKVSEQKSIVESKPEKQEEGKSRDVPDWVRDLVQPQAAAPVQMAKQPDPKLVVVPDRFVSKVVGYQGCTLKEIQAATGTYIQVDQSTVKRQGYALATIVGPLQQNIDAAEAMLKTRIESGIQTHQAYVAGKHGMGKGGYLQMGLGLL